MHVKTNKKSLTFQHQLNSPLSNPQPLKKQSLKSLITPPPRADEPPTPAAITDTSARGPSVTFHNQTTQFTSTQEH